MLPCGGVWRGDVARSPTRVMSVAREPPSHHRDGVLEAVVLTVWVFLLYAAGACPTIYVGDSGELVAAAHTLGIPHPSGYPLYVLTGKLFTLLVPLGSVAYRMSLFSAVFAAGAVGLLYTTARRAGLHPVACGFGASLLAVSPSYWAEANVQRVYSLNASFVVVSLALFFEWYRSGSPRNPRWLYLAFFVAGLGATNHTFMAVQAGVMFATALVYEPSLATRVLRLAAIAGSFGVGLLPYLYLPLRARDDPPVVWGRPETLTGFLDVVLRRNYWDQAWVEGPFDVIRVAGDYVWSFGTELLWIGAALAVVGALASRSRVWPRLLLPLVMGANLLALVLHGSRTDLFMWHRYYIPSYVAASLLAAFGCDALCRRLPRRVRFAPLVLPLVGLFSGFGDFDRSRYRVAEDFGRKLLSSLPEGAYLSASGDNVLFPLMYLHDVEDVRPDVHLILQGVLDADRPPLSFRPDEDALYFTHHPNWRVAGLVVVPAGLAFRVVGTGDVVPDGGIAHDGANPSLKTSILIPSGKLAGDGDPSVPKDYLSRNLIGHYHFMLGTTFAGRDWPRALDELDEAAAAAPDNDVLFYNLGLLYSRNGLYSEAFEAFRRSAAINPRPLAGSPKAMARVRLDEVRLELDRLGAIELKFQNELPPLGAPERASALAERLDLLGERLAARGYRIRALHR